MFSKSERVTVCQINAFRAWMHKCVSQINVPGAWTRNCVRQINALRT
jgi:hypothetical protein